FSLTADFGRAGFSFGSLFVETLLPLQLTFKDDLLSVSGLNWKSEGLRMQVEGDLGFKSKQGELVAELRFPLTILSKLSADFLSRRGPDEAGRLKVVAGQGELWMQSKIRGALGQPREIEPAVELQLSEGSLFISGLQANQLTLEKINLQARLNKEALTVSNVSFNLGGAQIAGCGRLPLAGLISGEPGEAEISLAFWRLDPFDFVAPQLEKLPPFLREKFLAGARGEVNGELNLSFVPTPEKWVSTVNGKITLTSLMLNLRELILANKQPIILHLEPGHVWLKETEITSEALNLRLGAELRHPFSLLSPQAELTAFLRVTGGLEALSPWFEAAKLRGQTALSVSFAGPVAKVEPRATLELRRVSVEFPSFSLRLSDISGYFFYSGGRLNLQSFRGLANGGPWEIGGFLETNGAGRLKSAEIQILIKDFPLEVEDMVTAGLEASLRLESVREKLALSGEIAVRKVEVVADISQVSQWLPRRTSFYRRPRATTPPFAQKIGLNVRINFTEPVTIVNSFLRTQVGGSLTVSGTLGEPAILGRLTNAKAGEFTWAEKRYRLEKIQVDFTGTFPPDPKLEIIAQTELVHRYEQVEVKLLLSGPVSDLRLSFQSSPPRSQEELAFLLLTGKSIEEMRTEGLRGLREQVLLALATPTSSRLGGAMRRLLGVEEVRIEPLGIAGETDPGARLTFVKQITPAARVTTSVDVTNSQRQTWTLDYRLTGGMIFQVFRKDDGSYGAGARHSLSLGKDKEGTKPSQGEAGSPASLTGKKIASVEIEGESFFPADLIQKKLGSLRPGMIFASNRLEAGIKRLVSFYRQHQFLQVMITPQVVAEGEKGVRVILEISAGPKIEIEYRGDSLPRPIRRRVESLWSRETNLEVAARRSANLVEKALRSLGYYQATVKWELKVGEKRVYFPLTVTKGQRYRLGNVKVDAASQERAANLGRQIKSWRTQDTKGFWLLVIEPRAAAEAAQAWYEEQGFLQAKVGVVALEERQKRTVNILVKVEEGPQSFVRQVRIEGNREVAVSELEARLEIRAGQPFEPSRLMTDRSRLLAFLRRQGYLDAAVTSRVEFSDSGHDVDVFFGIEEGVVHRVAEVEFSGQSKAQTQKLDQIFGLQPGEKLSFERLAEGQKTLYDLGDFSLVQVMTEPWTGDATLGQDKVRVELRREPALNLRYGLRYDSEAKTEVTAGLDFRHLFGLGRHGLVNFIYNERMQDWRFSFHDRSFLGLKIDSLLSFYLTQKKETGFMTDESGGSWRHQFTLPGKVLLSLLARRSRIHTYEKQPASPFPFDISLSLTELTIQAVGDFRDDPLDPRRGSFFSSSLTYSPEKLGSELTYLSWFGQASFYQPLGSKLGFSANFRLGLATAFDQVMVPARRFYAGGGYSVRGFRQDRLGPYDPYLEQPEGGEAVFISNQELRVNLIPGIDGVIFYDAGNVFPEVKDISLRGLRHSAGMGLRLRSPVGLLRFDLGFNLRPKPGEPRQLFFFTLGQIF
ncbi:MAG: translocation/assembly module TamB domain-containing protein, partial [Candidatus Aminicenantales bacterium]